MGTKTGELKRVAGRNAPTRARLVPAQQRSRERFERILVCAAEVMTDKGSEGFRMSDIVERTGVAYGSLYQYFPDKAAVIAALAERYNVIAHECVSRDLSSMKTEENLHHVLCSITENYYQMFIDNPVMRDVWTATQADRALQRLDEEDCAYLAGLLSKSLRPVALDVSEAALSTYAQLLMTLIGAAVRHAITLSPAEAYLFLELFKHVLPMNMSALR